MSASHRKLGRLPLSIFEGLVDDDDDDPEYGRTSIAPEELRAKICFKLKRFPVKSTRAGVSTAASVKTVGDLLRTSKHTLLHALDPIFTYEELCLFLKRTYQECAAKPVSALELLHSTIDDVSQLNHRSSRQQQPQLEDDNDNTLVNKLRSVPCGLPSLDRALGGGIRVGTITELVGPAGIGKTQLAFQLCIMAARYRQGAMYIDTEKKINLQRLQEMCWQQRHDAAQLHGSAYDIEEAFPFQKPEQVLSNLSVHTPGSTAELLQFLDQAEDAILNHKGYPIRLLIVDSIAAPMKRDFGSDSAVQRAAAIFKCAQILKRLADQLPLAVIAINQVGLQTTTNSNTTRDLARNLRASLGTSWRHCVSTSLLLTHESTNGTEEGHYGDHVNFDIRKVSIVKSNRAPLSQVHFKVAQVGLVEVAPPSDDDVDAM